MTTASCIQCRVTAETKALLRAIARRQQLTDSAFLRRLVDMTLQTAGAAPRELTEHGAIAARTVRLTIRLLPDGYLTDNVGRLRTALCPMTEMDPIRTLTPLVARFSVIRV